MPNFNQKKKNTKWVWGVVILVIIAIPSSLYLGSRSGKKDEDKKEDVQPTVVPTNTVTPTTDSTGTPEVTITSTPTLTTTPSITGTPTTVPETTETGVKQVKIFFSKEPESDTNFTYASYRIRSSNRMDIATYSVEQLIAGPNVTEKETGLYTPLVLSGDSSCEGKDFTLTIDSAQKATIKFCKSIESGGTGSDARIKSVITYTLEQFETVENVVILTKDDRCFGDMSGRDTCKQ